jgi:two-component system response regulator DesR
MDIVDQDSILYPAMAITTHDDSVSALVEDAHVPTRIGLGVMLLRQPWVARCLLAAGSGESIGLVRRHRPDLAIVDISEAGPFVASVIAPLRDAHPAIRIVLSSRRETLSFSPAAVGAVAFVPAETTSEEIIDTIRTALVSSMPPPAASCGSGLTSREREILLLLSTGATNREIASELCLGPDAVKKHATALYRKLGVRNRTAAAQRAAATLAHDGAQVHNGAGVEPSHQLRPAAITATRRERSHEHNPA